MNVIITLLNSVAEREIYIEVLQGLKIPNEILNFDWRKDFVV
jgi:hypothetical protein